MVDWADSFGIHDKSHLQSQCLSIQQCQKCERPHLTPLHPTIESTAWAGASQGNIAVTETSTKAIHHSYISYPYPRCGQGLVLLMTCRVCVTKEESLSSSTSFVTNQLAQSLQMPQQWRQVKIAGIGGTTNGLCMHSIASGKSEEAGLWWHSSTPH